MSLTDTQRALAHAREAERLLNEIAEDQPVVKPHVRLLAVQAQALTSIALSLAMLVGATQQQEVPDAATH